MQDGQRVLLVCKRLTPSVITIPLSPITVSVRRTWHRWPKPVVDGGRLKTKTTTCSRPRATISNITQLPLSPRLNGLPVKLIDWSRLMIREYATRALIELMQIGPTPSSTDPVLHHAPEAFDVIVTTHK